MRKFATWLLLLAAAAALLAAIAIRSRVGHPVTRRMQAAAKTAAGRPAPPLPGVAWGRPIVLFFIQDGCPCSEAAEPYFQRLAAAYGAHVRFFGIVEGEPDVADRWRREHQTPYPVLADPERAIIRGSRAERSAYTVLITADGVVERLWPGYSAAMLRDLGARLADAVGIDQSDLDLEGAPEVLTSGCPFQVELEPSPADSNARRGEFGRFEPEDSVATARDRG